MISFGWKLCCQSLFVLVINIYILSLEKSVWWNRRKKEIDISNFANYMVGLKTDFERGLEDFKKIAKRCTTIE